MTPEKESFDDAVTRLTKDAAGVPMTLYVGWHLVPSTLLGNFYRGFELLPVSKLRRRFKGIDKPNDILVVMADDIFMGMAFPLPLDLTDLPTYETPTGHEIVEDAEGWSLGVTRPKRLEHGSVAELLYAVSALSGEAGAVTQMTGRLVRDHKLIVREGVNQFYTNPVPEDCRLALKAGLGNVLHRLLLAARQLDYTLDELLREEIET